MNNLEKRLTLLQEGIDDTWAKLNLDEKFAKLAHLQEESAKPSINPEIRERLVKISKSKLTEKIQERAEIQNQQIQAESMLGKIMDKLEYVGVMAMECFVLGDKLLINELAPRVHNSGHWTQLGCAISQFELHLRALLDLPTPSLQPIAPSVMVNLIGTKHNPQWLNTPFSQLHWYGKEVRPGRKLGHINITHPDKTIIIQQLEKLRHELPEDYQSGLNWAIEKLK